MSIWRRYGGEKRNTMTEEQLKEMIQQAVKQKSYILYCDEFCRADVYAALDLTDDALKEIILPREKHPRDFDPFEPVYGVKISRSKYLNGDNDSFYDFLKEETWIGTGTHRQLIAIGITEHSEYLVVIFNH